MDPLKSKPPIATINRAAVTVAIMAAAGTAPITTHAAYTLEDFFPVGTETSWTWEIDSLGTAPYTVDKFVAGTENLHGTTAYEFYAPELAPPDASYSTERSRWFSNSEGLRGHRIDVSGDQEEAWTYHDPIQYIPAQFAAGETYESSAEVTVDFGGAQELNGTATTTATVVGEEPVSVPAGSFDAVRVDLVEELEDEDGVSVGQQNYSWWFAEGVGIVRHDYGDVVWSLVAYSEVDEPDDSEPDAEFRLVDYEPIETVGASRDYRILDGTGQVVGDLSETVVEEEADGNFRLDVLSHLGEMEGSGTLRQRFNEANERLLASTEFSQNASDGTVFFDSSIVYEAPAENFASLAYGEEGTVLMDLTQTTEEFGGDPEQRTGTEEVGVRFAAIEEVTVPAGTFETFRLEITTTITYDDDPGNPDVDIETAWYAEGIGAVKRVFEQDSEEEAAVHEMTDYSIPGGPDESGTSFTDWADSYNLSEGEDSPEANPSGDGVANALKYALGLDPLEAAADQVPIPYVGGFDEGDFLTMDIPLNQTATDVELIVEVSDNLVEWESGSGQVTVLEETDSLLKVRDNTGTDVSDNRFMRIRAEIVE